MHTHGTWSGVTRERVCSVYPSRHTHHDGANQMKHTYTLARGYLSFYWLIYSIRDVLFLFALVFFL